MALTMERCSASAPISPNINALNPTDTRTQAIVPNSVQRPTLDQLCRAVKVLDGINAILLS